MNDKKDDDEEFLWIDNLSNFLKNKILLRYKYASIAFCSYVGILVALVAVVTINSGLQIYFEYIVIYAVEPLVVIRQMLGNYRSFQSISGFEIIFMLLLYGLIIAIFCQWIHYTRFFSKEI